MFAPFRAFTAAKGIAGISIRFLRRFRLVFVTISDIVVISLNQTDNRRRESFSCHLRDAALWSRSSKDSFPPIPLRGNTWFCC